MKKIWIGLAVFSILALTFVAVNFAYAQGGINHWGGFHNSAMMGGSYGDHDYDMMGEYDHDEHGMMHAGNDFHMMGDEGGPMHDAMSASMAKALGLTPEQLEARHDAGETHWQIAESQGFSEEDFQTLMVTARDEALALAVADGQITQELADEMLSHMGDGSIGSGYCHGDGAGMGQHRMNWDTKTGVRP